MSQLAVVIKAWPIILTLGTGLVGYGILKADVGDIKARQVVSTKDHDLLVELKAHGQDQDKKLDELKDDIKTIIEQTRHKGR